MSDLIFEFLLLTCQYLKPLVFLPPEVERWIVKVRLFLDAVLFTYKNCISCPLSLSTAGLS